MSRILPALALLLSASSAAAVQPGFKIYDDQFAFVPLERITAGLDIENATLSQLTTSGAANAATLEALSAWDFTPSRNVAGALDAYGQAVPVDSRWTCYLPDTIGCGFGASDVEVLLVGDGHTNGHVSRSVSAAAYDPATGILRGRATISDEGRSGGLTDSEIRLCLGTAADAPLVPVAVFANIEAGTSRRYMQAGDPQWQSPVFNCLPIATIGAPCRAAGGTRATVTSSSGQTEGRIRNRIVKAGTVTLPSGHVVDALLLESFTSYSGRDSSCFLNLLTYRQWRLAWVVPHYGPLLSLTSQDDTPQLSGFTTAKGTFLGYGLLPPVSIQATQVDPTAVTVSWNPGLLGERFVDGYEVHWGAVSGKDQAPQFHSGAIAAGTTSYTITGLTPGQRIFVSVTSRKTYTDPKSGIATSYESIALPKFLGADTNGDGTLDASYPPEISVTTPVVQGCVPGDIAPDNAGDGFVSIADMALGRRKLVGTVATNDRDRSCGDVHPGAFACQPQGQPGRWCATPNGAFQLGDVITIRRKILGTITFACTGCPQTAGGVGDPRLPGDVTPRGATDGRLDIGDVVFALRASVNLDTPSAEERMRLDVAPADRASGSAVPMPDGRVDITDVVLMLRASVSLEQLKWPVRKIRARLTDTVDFLGFRVEVSGWPAWAAPEANFSAVTCDDTTQAATAGSWAGVCLTDPTILHGPTDLLDFQYRAIEPVDPASLTVVAGRGVTYVTLPDFSEPQANVTLSAP